MKKLRNLCLSVTGTKEEILSRIIKYQRHPNLIKKLKITGSPVLNDTLNSTGGVPESGKKKHIERAFNCIIVSDFEEHLTEVRTTAPPFFFV